MDLVSEISSFSHQVERIFKRKKAMKKYLKIAQTCRHRTRCMHRSKHRKGGNIKDLYILETEFVFGK